MREEYHSAFPTEVLPKTRGWRVSARTPFLLASPSYLESPILQTGLPPLCSCALLDDPRWSYYLRFSL